MGTTALSFKVHVTIGIATNSTSEIFLSNIQIMFIEKAKTNKQTNKQTSKQAN